MAFFDDNLLLKGESAKQIYSQIASLPIIDYHCHLNAEEILRDKVFGDVGELWLSGDHYKWRAMRLCGVDEQYVTGNKSYKEKFIKYAEIMPKLIGNPLYYWTHMELSRLFGITKPLNGDSAEEIWRQANEALGQYSVRKLLDKFKLEYVATTDDPTSDLPFHGDVGGVKVRPTFRPDGCFAQGMDKAYLEGRLDYFISKGCKIADCGFDDFTDLSDLEWLIEVCGKRGVIVQLHFGTFRNVNTAAYKAIGRDSGFDVFRGGVSTDALVALLDGCSQKLGTLPQIILYPLNDNYLKAVCAISGAFKNVRVGAAWWFNDTVCGIRRQLETVSEYAALGTNLGMLTDSRSFSSYVRFDFYRRLLATFIGEKTDSGEYDLEAAVSLARDIAYYNVKEVLGL